MNADDRRPGTRPSGIPDTRRRIVEAASQLMRERGGTDSGGEPSSALRFETYLALLQDRLPVWNRVLGDLSHLVGKAEVNEVLIPVARAAVEFYVEIHNAQVIAFSTPDQLMRFRQAMNRNHLGPQQSLKPLAGYLAAEQRLGRVASDVDPDAAARLLLGACFQHAFIEVVMGADAVPPREETADRVVYGLRLQPRDDGRCPDVPEAADARSRNGSGPYPGAAEPPATPPGTARRP